MNTELTQLDRKFNTSKTMHVETYNAQRAEILARAQQKHEEPAPAPQAPAFDEARLLQVLAPRKAVELSVAEEAELTRFREQFDAAASRADMNAMTAIFEDPRHSALAGKNCRAVVSATLRRLYEKSGGAFLAKALHVIGSLCFDRIREVQLFSQIQHARASKIEARIADLEQRIESTETKRRADSAVASSRREWYENALASVQVDVDELRAQRQFHYCGVWSENQEYSEHDFVTQQGSLWACLQKTRSRPGVSPEFWQLAVKRGADGKDAR